MPLPLSKKRGVRWELADKNADLMQGLFNLLQVG